MFGSIISCTDPIAVVSLLKSLCVNKRLNTIIEGESLINDATGLILYTIGLKTYFGGSTSIFSVLGLFIRYYIYIFSLTGGGLLLGGVIGFIVAIVMKNLFNDTLM